MRKQFAAHQVIVSANCRFKQQVVEIEDKIVSGYFPLTEEIASTEWVGGTIILSSYRSDEIKQITFPMEFESLIMLLTENQTLPVRYAWHVSAEDTSAGIVHSIRQLI